MLSPSEAALLAAGAAAAPAKAVGVFRRSRALVGRIDSMLEALGGGADPAAADLRAFNYELRTALGARELGAGGRGWCWREVGAGDLDRVLWPVAVSAAEVLSSEARDLVRSCARDGYGQLFLARRASGTRGLLRLAGAPRRQPRAIRFGPLGAKTPSSLNFRLTCGEPGL